jgi:hypothetical protein
METATATEQVVGLHQGYVPNQEWREKYKGCGGAKAKAIEMIELVTVRPGRTTSELCDELEVDRKQLNTITDIARKFVKGRENGFIRAVPNQLRLPDRSGSWFCYYLIYDPDGMMNSILDFLVAGFARQENGFKLLEVASAYSLSGRAKEMHDLFNALRQATQPMISQFLRIADNISPGSVAQSKLKNLPPLDHLSGEPPGSNKYIGTLVAHVLPVAGGSKNGASTGPWAGR